METADGLGIEPVRLVGHLTCFWLWAVDNADNNGLLIGHPRAKTIARAALWTGDVDHFLSALVIGGFLDELDDGYTIHDWAQHFGKFAQQRERDAERKREERAAERQRTGTDERRREDQSSENRRVSATRVDPSLRTSNGHTEAVPSSRARPPAAAAAQTRPNLTGSTDMECHVDPESRASAREDGPDVATPRAVTNEDDEPESIPPKWEELASGIHHGQPNGKGEVRLLKARCLKCERSMPVDQIEDHECTLVVGESVHRGHSTPGNLGWHLRRYRQDEPSREEIEAELAAAARDKANQPIEHPPDLVAEHERILAAQRTRAAPSPPNKQPTPSTPETPVPAAG